MISNEHGPYSGVVDIARNGIDEVIRLRALNAELRRICGGDDDTR